VGGEGVELEVVVTPGLGDNSYLLAVGGEAVVIDPQRDAGRFLALARLHGATITHVLETHVHNDYLSGALELRAATGAEVVAPAAGRYGFEHRGVTEGDEVAVGGLRLVAMETPGHTPEHLSYVLQGAGGDSTGADGRAGGDSTGAAGRPDGSRAAEPIAVFTGGSLMVGGAGRTDLVGPDWTDRLTRDQFRSLRRLASLPDHVAVYPTHGAGSFCGAGDAPKERTSTIGEERARNPAMGQPDEEAFVRRQLDGLLSYPTYYRHMAPINRQGPRVLGEPPTPGPLSPDEVAARMEAGAWVVDARWRVQFARAHVPGSVNVELDDTFGSYVGWVVPFGDPLVLVLPDPVQEALEEAASQLLRIGYERIEGHLAGGVEAWRAAGRPVASYPVAGLEALCRELRAGRDPRILDVRQAAEWRQGSIPGSRRVFVGDVPGAADRLAGEGELWVMCATGHRASLASSLLDRAGGAVRLVDGTGVADFLAHCAPDLGMKPEYPGG
jgi:hydroxyacylglutathione hydrolase